MTYSSHTKVFKQLEKKPAKLQKFIKHNAPKKRMFGRNVKRCGICDRSGAHLIQVWVKPVQTMFQRECKKIRIQEIQLK